MGRAGFVVKIWPLRQVQNLGRPAQSAAPFTVT